MEQVFDFLARYGSIVVGALAFLVTTALIMVIVIELIDFLFVDPIKKVAERSAEERLKEDD